MYQTNPSVFIFIKFNPPVEKRVTLLLRLGALRAGKRHMLRGVRGALGVLMGNREPNGGDLLPNDRIYMDL